MKMRKQGKFAVKVGQEFPVTLTGATEIKITYQVIEKNNSLSVKAAAVAIVAVFVSGAVAAATVYGVATGDYSLLMDLAESVKTVMGLFKKLLA